MTTVPLTTPAPTPDTPTRPSTRLRRITAISRAEVTLFIRNRTILVTAVVLAPLMVLVLAPLLGERSAGSAFTVFVLQMLSAWSLLFVIYYNLTCILVARREEGVFQRMSTGEATPWEALAAACVPSGLVSVVQMVLGGAVAAIWFGSPPFTNVVLVVAAVLAGIVCLSALAAWTSSLTSTVEGAQYSTMPLLLVLLVFSGTNVPLQALPDVWQTIAALTPLHAIADLVGLGLAGTALPTGSDAAAPVDFAGSWGAAVRPAAALAVWVALALWAGRARMRFSRRR